MDYEKKYKEAFERAKKLQETCDSNTIVGWMEYIFPELTESEDERTRKGLIQLISCMHDADRRKKDWLAWLEKQGEPNPYSGISFKHDGHIWGMCARDNGVEIIFDGELKAFLSLEKSFIYPIHPQKSLAPKSAMEAIKEEKVDNANKIEPKFKVGDWVTDGVCKFQIRFIDNIQYWYSENCILGSIESIDKKYHLWTIQDAKDGDVLVNGSNIFIFHFINDTRLMGYCHVNIDDGRFYDDIGKNECFCLIDAVVNPATKEQRDLLFQKIYKAGYEWDADKKELNKIEQKPEHPYCQEHCKGYKESGGKCYFGFDCEAKREAEKKPVWSEEDSQRLQRIADFLWHNRKGDTDTIYQQEQDIDWLKSLKDRVQLQPHWNPSDEQLDALHDAAVYVDKSMFPHPKGILMKLYKQLKKQTKQYHPQ